MNENKQLLFYWPLLALLTWLAALDWVWSKIGGTGMAWGFPLSVLITLPMASTFLWLGRWVQGRQGLLLSAFAWGASVAGFCSIWSQEGMQFLVNRQFGSDLVHWFGPLVSRKSCTGHGTGLALPAAIRS
jgi:protease PrsW